VIDELKTAVGAAYLIVNRVNGDQRPSPCSRPSLSVSSNSPAFVPADPAIGDLDAKGEPIVRLADQAPARRGLAAILSSLDGGCKTRRDERSSAVRKTGRPARPL